MNREKKENIPGTSTTEEERVRRKREITIIAIIIPVIALLTFAEVRIAHFGANFPISNTILMFILINISLLLLLLLIFLVFRNLVKLYYDRRHKALGAKLRTKLVVALISMTLLPTIVLFFFSIQFISNSIAFWFNVPVEQALENSLTVGDRLYKHIEENSSFFLERVAYQVQKKKYLEPSKSKALNHYIMVSHRAFNLDAIEIYDDSLARVASAIDPKLSNRYFTPLSASNLLKDFNNKNIHTVSQFVPYGELRRTIGTIPFGVAAEKAKAFVAITIIIPRDLSSNLASVSRGFEEYQQIKLLKKPIQISYYIALSIVALLVVFSAVWFAFYLAKTITIPIMELAEGTRRVAEGDLSFNIDVKADDEIGSLVESFNTMTRDLSIGREQLSLSTRMLKQQNIEIEESRQYMEIVLKNVSAGVISLDPSGHIITINKSAERMLSVDSDDILKNSFSDLLKGQSQNVINEIQEKMAQAGDGIEFPLNLLINDKPLSFVVHFNALKDDSGQNMGLVMVFDDLTELEKAQRMAAWREVARRIAHEVKNPLTPISLSAQRLKRKYSTVVSEPVFDECTRTIIDHVELIRNLVNAFAAFAKFPTANPKPADLPSIIEETVVLYKEGHQNISFSTTLVNNIPSLNLDRQHIKQAMINLFDNAISSIKNQGNVDISVVHVPEIKTVRLEVADTGSGIPNIVKSRLFEPYFSTKKAGTGLGLAIVNSIIADHNGTIRVEDNKPRGARFIIDFPD